jgi:hypothetical protein
MYDLRRGEAAPQIMHYKRKKGSATRSTEQISFDKSLALWYDAVTEVTYRS